MMKMSLEIKALVLGLIVSGSALGLSFGAGALLRQTAAPVEQAQSTAASLPDRKAEVSMSPEAVKPGRTLFLKNCAHCHADDATGDEGPDLHRLKRSDEWIARRIRNGVKGEMTAFGEKFSQPDVDALIAYLRTLK